MQLQVVYTEALESPRLFQRETLNLTQGKRASAAQFRRLYQYKEDKAITVWWKLVALTIYIKVILILLRGFFGGLLFWGDWLQLKKTSPCRTLLLFLSVLSGSWDGDWTSRITWCKLLYSKEFLRAFRSLYRTEAR